MYINLKYTFFPTYDIMRLNKIRNKEGGQDIENEKNLSALLAEEIKNLRAYIVSLEDYIRFLEARATVAGRKPLEKETIKLILAFKERGFSHSQTAKELGISRSVVAKYWKQATIKAKAKGTEQLKKD